MEAGLYIHIPFCERKCAYCDFYSVAADEELKRKYIDKVIAEGADKLKDASIHTLFIGGGTPTCLPSGELARLISGLKTDVRRLKEFTVECNPNSLTDFKIAEYKSVGVTRLSIGIQSLCGKCLNAIGRLHDAKTAVSAITRAVAANFDVSADYMVGLPHQTLDGVKREVRELLKLGINHLSCYSLMLEEGTKLYNAVRGGSITVPDEDATVDMYDAVLKIAEESGLSRYETSNFGKPCLHNLGYWKEREYIGLGAAAHGFVLLNRFLNWKIASSVRQLHDINGAYGVRYSNSADVCEYISSCAFSAEPVTIRDAASEFIMLGLRLDGGVDLNELKARFGETALKDLTEKSHKFEKFLDIDADKIAVKREFSYVSNSIIAELI